MPAEFGWVEDNGAAAGDPAKGTSRTFRRTETDWKNVDDSTTAYTSSAISAGSNSFIKYQFGVFTGSFNEISDVRFNHSSGHLSVGVDLYITGSSGYVTPATTLMDNPVLASIPSGLGAAGGYIPIVLGTVGPEEAGSTTLSASGYTSYLISQLATTASAPAGDIPSGITLGLRYTES